MEINYAQFEQILEEITSQQPYVLMWQRLPTHKIRFSYFKNVQSLYQLHFEQKKQQYNTSKILEIYAITDKSDSENKTLPILL